MKQIRRHSLVRSAITVVALVVLAAACAPAATPTPTPTKAAPATAPAKVEATKPAGEPTKPPAPVATPTAAPAKATGKPLKIGFLTIVTGPLASVGHRLMVAAEMGLADLNQAGGVNGQPFELVRGDSRCDPKEAATLVPKLVQQDRVLAVIGAICSSEFEVGAPLINELQAPLIVTLSSKQGITAANRPWAFRFTLTDDQTFPVALDGFKKVYPQVKKLVITGNVKESVNENTVKVLAPKLLKERGYDIIDTVAFETGTTDFAAIVTKIKDLRPDGLAVSALTPETVALSRELDRQGVKVPVVASSPTWAGPEISIAPQFMEGWVAPAYFDQDSTDPRVQSYVSRFKQQGEADPVIPKPVFPTLEASTYDTIMILADIMRKNSITADTPVQEARTKLRDGLQTLKDFKGLVGSITTLPSGDVYWDPFPVKAEKGKFVAIR